MFSSFWFSKSVDLVRWVPQHSPFLKPKIETFDGAEVAQTILDSSIGIVV